MSITLIKRILFKSNRPSKDLPAVKFRHLNDHLVASFVAPNRWFSAECLKADGSTVVGYVSYGISPLHDRIYIGEVRVNSGFQRQGFASSLLQELSMKYALNGKALPVTPLGEVESSWDFWAKLRDGAVPGLVVTWEVSMEDQVKEKERWDYLKSAEQA